MAELNGNSFKINMEPSETTKKTSLKDLSKENLVALLKKSKMRSDDLNKKYLALEKKHEKEMSSLNGLLSINDVETVEELGLKIEQISLKLERVAAEKETVMTEKALQDERWQAKEEELSSLKASSDVISSENESFARKIHHAEEEAQCMQMKLHTLTETCKFLQDEVSRLNSANIDLKKEVSILSEARDTALQALKKLKEDSMIPDNEEIKNLQRHCAELETQLASVTQTEKFIQDLKERNGYLEKENAELMEKCKTLSLENVNLDNCAKDMDFEVTSLNEKLRDLLSFKENYAELEKCSEQLEVKCSSLKEKCEALECEKVHLIEEKEALKEKAILVETQASSQKKLYDEQRSKLEEELDDSRHKINDLIESNTELAKQVSTNNKLQEELSKAKLQIEDLEKNIFDLEKGMNEVNEKNSCLSDQICKLSQDLKQQDIEKNLLLSEVEVAVQGMLVSREEEREKDPHHIIQLLKYTSIEFNEMKIQLDSLKTEKADEEVNRRAKERTENAETQTTEEVETESKRLVGERESLLRENEELKATNSVLESSVNEEKLSLYDLREKYSASLAEIESLKLQLDEYESDIQKHQNLEQENFKLMECVKELEKDNYELNEFLDNKYAEINEANLQAESIITSILNHTGEKESNSALQNEKSVLDNILILKSLCEDIVLQKDRSVDLLKKIEMDVLDLSRIKQNMSSEIEQLKSLNQFLEDEIRELREEVEQVNSKSGINAAELTTKEIVCQVEIGEFIDNSSQTELDKKCIKSCDVSVQVEFLDNSEKPMFTHSVSFPGGFSEWGYTATNDNDTFCSVDAGQNDTAENLTKENKELKSLLETKSNLVEQIHCQVDSLLSKVEELTEELESKDSELKYLNHENKCKADAITILQERIKSMTGITKNISIQVTSLKQLKCDLLKFVRDLNSVHEQVVSSLRNALTDINLMSSNYDSSMVSVNDENKNLKSEISEICELLCELSKSVSSRLNLFSSAETVSEDNVYDATKLHCDTPKVILQKLISDFSNIQIAQNSSNSSLAASIVHKGRDEEQMQASISKKPRSLSEPDSCKDVGSVDSKCESCENLQKEISEMTNKSNKFKAIAIKMKKELASSTHLKENLEKKLQEKSQELNSALDLHAKIVNNFQNIQSDYDNLQDEFEVVKAAHKSLQNQLAEKDSELSNFLKTNHELELTSSKMQKQLESIESDKSMTENKCMDAESKIIILQAKNAELNEKISQLTTDLSKCQAETCDAVQEKERFKKELESALKEGNKHSLLDLEMADYERTISDMTIQLEKKTEEIKDLRKDVEDQITKIFSLQEEIKFSESSRHTEEKRAESFKQALENNKKELMVVREQESELREEVAKLNMKIETLLLLENDYKATITKQSAEMEQLKDMLKSTSESHQRIVQNLNSKIATQKQEITMTHKEVESVKQNFENYKTRVHNVLKQQKTVSPFTTSDAEVREKLETQNEKLKLQVKDLSEKLQALTLESESLHDEHEHLLQRHDAVIQELEAKGRQWNLRLEQFNIEKTNLEAQLEDKASQYTLQVEMLSSTYKKQIKLMREEHKHALEELHKQLESADVEISRLQREHQNNNNVNSVLTMNEDSLAFDILSQERQEGEGSEFTDGTMTPVKHYSLATIPTGGFLPLEKLLQSPTESEAGISVVSNQDSEKLSADLNAAGKKIDHLSELLNESEANNLHMSDQIRLLKDELRRLERNKQREAHAENLEYLKNVFVKFATLQPGSERSTLVPVLNTILKLSPEEHQQLKNVAGGADIADQSTGGWGSYLHRWSGVM